MFQPSYELLKKYADVLVKFALWSGKGAKKDDVIFIQIPECAKPFYLPLQNAILESGAHGIFEYLPDGVARNFYENASDDQIKFYPSHYLEGKIKQMTHVISVIAEHDKYELKGIDGKKIAARVSSRKKYMQKRIKKENEGKMTWTLGLYGTKAMADDVGMDLKDYRDQIIKACYLDCENPINEWEKNLKMMDKIKYQLDNLPIEYVKIQGEDVDLKIKIGKDRQRLGGSGRNIPSFEIFTSPDRRGTEGRIKFNQPLYIYGNMIKGISLKFEKGIVTSFDAQENKELLKEIINIKNANKIGEFSLTDARLSRIDKFMGDTLYDENIGGEFGNTHIALGNAFDDCWKGNVSKMKKSDLKKLGFNECVEHKDIISTTDRIVTAILENGEEKIIYKNGMFTFDIN